jgi:DNA-3-methyladenine glycosylase
MAQVAESMLASVSSRMEHAAPGDALERTFYDRDVVTVARELVGCSLVAGETWGVIVETEAYHHSEQACHAFVGVTERTRTLYGSPGRAYVYLSYGVHHLFNAVCEREGVGAAVLIRALEPAGGLARMRARRGVGGERELCSGPGKLAQALAIGPEHNGADLTAGDVRICPPAQGWANPSIVSALRVGITKATQLPWRFCAAGNPYVSRPRPKLSALG